MGEKPTAAWVLSLIGGILGFLGSLIYAIIGTAAVATMPMPGWLAGVGIAVCYWFVIAHLIIIIGALKIKSGEPKAVKTGGTLVLIFSILGGFNILALIGGILALTWKPTEAAATV
ncbi:hypothetical protein J4526_09035 [Desulfurococcaceae archaeon MEX13E-LK6-19]|nr:hypothetical protein J4526_09035 [Desulfurococcaceae archaeon MEX13E-LK6-19]